MSYGANTIYITHYFITQLSSPTVINTISADICDINSNHTLALGVVRAISIILLDVPGMFLILDLSNCIS